MDSTTCDDLSFDAGSAADKAGLTFSGQVNDSQRARRHQGFVRPSRRHMVAVLLPCVMSDIAQKELRNQVGEVLRRVEAGEILTVTVAGRPVAELGPAHRRRWVSGATLAGIWRGKAPRGLDADLERLPAGVVDPFAS